MDRGRHRAVLSAAAAGGVLLLTLANRSGAQGTSASVAPTVPPSPTPALVIPTATPWVQAAPPPTAPPAKPPPITLRLDKEGRYYFDKEKEPLSTDALLERVRKSGDLQGSSLRAIIRAEPGASYEAITAALNRLREAGINNVTFSQTTVPKANPPGPAPSPVAAPSSVPPSREETARAMARKREEELAKQHPLSTPPAKPPRDEPPLSPEDREAYQRNLGLWLAMPPEEKKAIRGLASERIQEEIEKAYQTSGLTLNDDQREVFALRYRQERRRLERDLQEKAKAERARRLPEIMERLKHEFPTATAAVNHPKPTPNPAATSSPTLPPPAR